MFEILQTPSLSGVFIQAKKKEKKRRKKSSRYCRNGKQIHVKTPEVSLVLVSYSMQCVYAQTLPLMSVYGCDLFRFGCVEGCFVFLELETYPVSISSRKERPEGKTAGGEDSQKE